jgi:hypothetical protein
MPGARRTHSPRVRNETKHTSVVTTGPLVSPGIPAMVLTAYFVLSPVSEFVLSPSSADMAGRTRSGRLCLRKLSTSNGCQDHTALPSAACAVRQRAVRSLTGLAQWKNPPCDHARAQRCRVHRIPPNVRDDRETPLSPGRDGEGQRFDLGQADTEMRMGLDCWNHIDTLEQITSFKTQDDDPTAPSLGNAPGAAASAGAVVIHLPHQRIDRVELQLVADEGDEGDIQRNSVKKSNRKISSATRLSRLVHAILRGKRRDKGRARIRGELCQII